MVELVEGARVTGGRAAVRQCGRCSPLGKDLGVWNRCQRIRPLDPGHRRPFKEVSERAIESARAPRKTIVNLFFEPSPYTDLLRIRGEAAQRGHGKRGGGGSIVQG
jgi:hypothetical protein